MTKKANMDGRLSANHKTQVSEDKHICSSWISAVRYDRYFVLEYVRLQFVVATISLYFNALPTEIQDIFGFLGEYLDKYVTKTARKRGNGHILHLPKKSLYKWFTPLSDKDRCFFQQFLHPPRNIGIGLYFIGFAGLTGGITFFVAFAMSRYIYG